MTLFINTGVDVTFGHKLQENVVANSSMIRGIPAALWCEPEKREEKT